MLRLTNQIVGAIYGRGHLKTYRFAQISPTPAKFCPPELCAKAVRAAARCAAKSADVHILPPHKRGLPRGAFSLQYIEISVAERARKNDTPRDFRAENAVTSQDEELEKIN